jgi:CheY-like chemotaxis protein
LSIPNFAGVKPDRMVTSPVLPNKVLVADDNEDVAALLTATLRMHGVEVQTAHNGAEAIEKAQSFQPQLIMLDVGMPVLDGHNACRAIRGTPWGRKIKIVALTGLDREDDRRMSAESGFDAHLVKPIRMEALIQAVSGIGSDALMSQ